MFISLSNLSDFKADAKKRLDKNASRYLLESQGYGNFPENWHATCKRESNLKKSSARRKYKCSGN
jgi:hypothetical protein